MVILGLGFLNDAPNGKRVACERHETLRIKSNSAKIPGIKTATDKRF